MAAEQAGQRLDQWLAAQSPALSRTRLQRLIKAGAVAVNDRVVQRPGHRLEAGDRVRVAATGEGSPVPLTGPGEQREAGLELPDPAEASPVRSQGPPLSVVYADAAIIVVDKPAGMVVHPAAGHPRGTLVDALLIAFPELGAAFGDRRPGIVHRLDRDTSGVMVVARRPELAEALQRQFQARTVGKVYLALIRGRLAPPEGLIEAPIGRDRRDRKRMAVLPGGRPARTRYRLLQTLPGELAWVAACPETGRTHQIRVHFAAIGRPVAGDPVYGRADPRVGRLALHARWLRLDHPVTGERMTFGAALPADLRAALLALGVAEPLLDADCGPDI